MRKKKQITLLLTDIRDGDTEAYNTLFSIVYDQLREIAGLQIRKNQTFSKTGLVHEVYIKLADYKEIHWKDRSHFFAIASRCMRQILVDYSRKKITEKRGGQHQHITLNEDQIDLDEHASHLIDLDNLIDELAKFDERKSKIVEMRFFAGMSIKEISEILNLSTRTVDRDWMKARSWLLSELR